MLGGGFRGSRRIRLKHRGEGKSRSVILVRIAGDRSGRRKRRNDDPLSPISEGEGKLGRSKTKELWKGLGRVFMPAPDTLKNQVTAEKGVSLLVFET